MSKKLFALLAVVFLMLAACSDDDDGDLADRVASEDTTQETEDTTETTEETEDTAATTEDDPDDTTPGGLDPARVEEEVEAALSESLSGLTGGSGSGDLAIDDDQMGCMVEAMTEDAALLDSMLEADSDPTYVASGDDMVSLFTMMDACGLVPTLATQFMAETPGLTQDQAECVIGGMVDLPASTWDAVMSGDPATMSADAMAPLLTIFTDCDVNPAAL